MAATFTWKVSEMNRVVADGGVLDVSFHCRAKETKDGKDYIEHLKGGTSLAKYDASDSGFIAFNDLTEAKVLEWVFSLENKTAMEARMQASIDERVAPTTIREEPTWGTSDQDSLVT